MSKQTTTRQAKTTLFQLIGLCLLLGCLAWAVWLWQFSSNAASAEGVVIGLNAGGSHPQVRFTTAAGEVIEYPQGGLIVGYQVGDRVRVLYDSSRPNQASIDTFGAKWGFLLLTVLLGFSFVLTAQMERQETDE